MISHDDVSRVLEALGEEFLVDVPAMFDKNGVYYIEHNELANALCNPTREWVDKIQGYVNSK